MWADLTGKVCTDNSNNFAGSNNWMTLERSGVTASATVSARAKYGRPRTGQICVTHSPLEATTTNTLSRFGRTGWYGRVAQQHLHFARVEGVDYALNYPAEIPTSCRPSTSTNQNIFVTDGISPVTIGRKATGSTSVPTCMNVLSFDWSASSYTQAMLSVVVADILIDCAQSSFWKLESAYY